MKKHLPLVLRLAFGALFIWSGVAKLKDPIVFADAVRNFEIIGDPLAAAVALFLPWIEVLSGIAVMSGILAGGGLAILNLAMAVFTIAFAVSWARGLDITCGCFGGTGPVNYPLSIVRNLAILAWGVWLWKRESGHEHSVAVPST